MRRCTLTVSIGLKVLAIVMLTGMCASQAAAHRVTVFAWVEGDTVRTESKFSGGKKVIGGKVIVTDLQGRRLVEGKTDENGAFSFKIPQQIAMRIELIAGMGHRGEWTVTAKEVGAAGPNQAESERRQISVNQPAGDVTPAAATTVGPADIERIVDEALDRKLEPIMRTLAQTRKTGPSPADIFSGIGYILGLVGLAAYVNYRKKEKDSSK